MANPNTRKSCVVPKCTSTTYRTPEKLFFIVPRDVNMRKKWIEAMKRLDPFSDKSTVYCCEDHFDLEEDMENRVKFNLTGGNIKLKKDVMPHKFECQKRQNNETDKPGSRKKIIRPERLEQIEVKTEGSDYFYEEETYEDADSEEDKDEDVRNVSTSLKADPLVLGEAGEDECSLFGKLVTMKLRRLPQERRDWLMMKVNELFYNEGQQHQN